MADMTPAAWLELLERRLDDRWARWSEYDRYFEGDHPLAFSTAKFREAFGVLLQGMSDNWSRIVVKSSTQRMKVTGFRFGEEKKADRDAWRIWQANGLDLESKMAQREAVKLGESYWLVDPTVEVADGIPQITSEHPREMIVACDKANRRRRLAALKRWVDDDEFAYANLYLPSGVYKWRSQEKARRGAGGRTQWVRRDGSAFLPNPLGVVPVVPLRNDPEMIGGGQSAIAPGIPLQNAINKECNDMLVASEYAAYRQRVMTGVEQPKDPITGIPLKIEMGVTRLLTVEAPDAKVYDLAASELKNYVQAIDMFVQHLAAQTQTPPHYLMGQIVNASGDALTAAEAGLNSRIDDEKESLAEGHEDMMRLAFRAMGDDARATEFNAETLWADSERRSFAQVVDGAGKLHEMGVPDEIVWEELGWSPQKIARAKAMQTADDLLRAAGSPAPPAGGDLGREAA
jgi:hypothetical protein